MKRIYALLTVAALLLAGQSSSDIAAIAKLVDGYDHFKLGFKLAK